MCVSLRCKKANGCYCVVARPFYSVHMGIPPMTSWNLLLVIRHNIHFQFRAPSSGCFQGDAERQSAEVISSSFNVNQVSIRLQLLSVMIPTQSWVVIPTSCNSGVRNLTRGLLIFYWFSCLVTRSQSGAFVSTRVSCRLSAALWFSLLGRVTRIRSP